MSASAELRTLADAIDGGRCSAEAAVKHIRAIAAKAGGLTRRTRTGAEVVLDAHEFGALATYATRYALGRRTYAVYDVCAMLRAQWRCISEADRSIILRDIREHFAESERLGWTMAECDEREWRGVLALECPEPLHDDKDGCPRCSR